jgi:hypothetical protein
MALETLAEIHKMDLLMNNYLLGNRIALGQFDAFDSIMS